MNISVSLMIDIILAIVIVSMIVAYAISVRHYQRKLFHLLTRLSDDQREQYLQLENQLNLTSKGSLGVGRRLMKAEKRLSQVIERQNEMENHHDTDQLSFNQAAKLLEKGIDLGEVVGKVGITRSEAQLVSLFNKKELETLEE